MLEPIILDLPKNVIERISEYQHARTTGQITLNFHEGRIRTFEFKQFGKVQKMAQSHDF